MRRDLPITALRDISCEARSFGLLTDALEVLAAWKQSSFVMSQSFQTHKSTFLACPNL